MRLLILGLTITSSWGNGHATTYRALSRALAARGHQITFLEKDVPWYREHRDLPRPSFCTVKLYEEWTAARSWLRTHLHEHDAVMIGSYFPDGIAAAQFVFEHGRCPTVFYDIDTPITLEALSRRGATEAISTDLVPEYDAYLSFTGGPMLHELERRYGARRAAPLYCSVDAEVYRPSSRSQRYAAELSYLGTYSADRQPKLERCLIDVARAMPASGFLVAGAQYPQMEWPVNVTWIEHVPPQEHPSFYSSSRFTLNLTRDAMVEAGYSPSVRLFEAAACGAAIISDNWPGLDEFFTPGKEILLAESRDAVKAVLTGTGEQESRRIGEAARERVLQKHTSTHRAIELEDILEAAMHRAEYVNCSGD